MSRMNDDQILQIATPNNHKNHKKQVLKYIGEVSPSLEEIEKECIG